MLRTDLSLINVLANLAETVAPEMRRIALRDVASDLKASMLGELDFRQEASNLVEVCVHVLYICACAYKVSTHIVVMRVRLSFLCVSPSLHDTVRRVLRTVRVH